MACCIQWDVYTHFNLVAESPIQHHVMLEIPVSFQQSYVWENIHAKNLDP